MSTWTVEQINAGTFGNPFSWSFSNTPGEVWLWGTLSAANATFNFSDISAPNRAVIVAGGSNNNNLTISNGSASANVPMGGFVAFIEVLFLSSTNMVVTVRVLNGDSEVGYYS